MRLVNHQMERALKQYFNICQIHIVVVNGWLPEEWKKFQTLELKLIDLTIEILLNKNLNGFVELFDLNSVTKCIRCDSEVAFLDCEGKKISILPLQYKENLLLLLLQAMYPSIVQHRIVQLHSSLISHKNQGILFLGPSGIGKTTQAELWNKYRDALIINGDIVFVQETPDAFLGWGTPWHGSSPYCENTSVPVAAMVVLKQAPENSIRELTGFEKVAEVSNSVFYPQWVEGGMELCLETLNHLLTKIPVYELSCRPDEGAVELVEQVVFDHVQ